MSGSDRRPQVELNRPRAARIGWRSSAVALAGLLVALIALGNLGKGPLPPTPRPEPAPTPVATETHAASPDATAPAPVGPRATGKVPLTMPFTPIPFAGQLPGDLPSVTVDSGARYGDGIPTSFRGNQVVRAGSAVNLPIGTTLLVAGWYRPLDCSSVLDGFWCRPGALFDLPAGSSRTGAVTVDVSLGKASGPRIVRATVSPNANCMLDGGIYCPPTLTVERVVWSGDRATLTAPIGPVALLSELNARFGYVDFMPLDVGVDCREALPAQAYAASPIVGVGPQTGLPLPVSLVLLFRSSSARRGIDTASLRGACPEIAAGLADLPGSSWIARRNVMLLSTGSATEAAVRDALAAVVKDGT